MFTKWSGDVSILSFWSDPMTTIAILGATGYTGVELIKILLRHPQAEITTLTSREETKSVDRVHPSLTGRLSLPLENLTPKQVAGRADCVFSCLPHCASAEVIPELLHCGAKVVDFSADYRLHSADVFKAWYGEEHPEPSRLGKVVYGLPELFRKEILGQSLIANPGCYTTSAILPLNPLITSGMVEPTDIIVDSKSGISGAGRKPKLSFHYPECNESISAYGVGTHRHTPEIELYTGAEKLIFTPHLTPMDRGILTVTYSKPKRSVTQTDVLELLRDTYRNEPFVQIVDHLPTTKDVSGTNNVHITARIVGGRVLTISVLDNLIKGASGAAVQNFNLLFGYPETLGLV